MKIFEFEQSDLNSAFYDPAEDKINTRIPSDTRKPKLTLKHLNKLKKIRALKRLQDLKHQDILAAMYSDGQEQEGGGPSMPGMF